MAKKQGSRKHHDLDKSKVGKKSMGGRAASSKAKSDRLSASAKANREKREAAAAAKKKR